MKHNQLLDITQEKMCTLYETELTYVSRRASTWHVINFLPVFSFSIHAAPYLWLLGVERFSGLQSQTAVSAQMGRWSFSRKSSDP